MPLNEADTRARLIDPKLKIAGWTDAQVSREYLYQKDRVYAPGRIILIGDQAHRGKQRKVDYLLRLTDSFPIAVIEAKSEEEPAETGLEQAKNYAADLGLAFAYATNGHEIIEYDFFTRCSRNINEFPRPEDLWKRWICNNGIPLEGTVPVNTAAETDPKRDPLRYPYCPPSLCNKEPFYFQEVAIREVIKRVLKGQKRILLTMATGTGKTFVAFQIVWKLLKSGWLTRRHPERPARILFLADRVILRDQAYNTFSPFERDGSDPRYKIEGFPVSLNRDLYFGIYQSLWSQDGTGRRLFDTFPPDFFDLIIIDECHRSGFGTWREILDHFESAIHLGMTATPKQDENIDTYAYFCAEEPEVAIDPDNPELGTWHPPAYQYSLGQGIEDGFLATYKVHRVRTTVDKDGLRLDDAIEQGAEVIIPEGVETREIYTTPDFEREITLPDRTKAMVKHLAGLLRRFGHMDKTMVFCVDMEHARFVARLLQDEFGPETGLNNYALPIISEEGADARRWLEEFADSDKKAPVVATTAELLSTGVDVPSCKNIVFMKTLSSPVLFKQIIGRGSRLDFLTNKYWFRIIDFTGATRLIDSWVTPIGPKPEPPAGPFTAKVKGIVFEAETERRIVGASVSIRTGPNTQMGPIRTNHEGEFYFDRLPAGRLTLIVNATGFIRREIQIETIEDEMISVEVALKTPQKGERKIRVEGITVTIADESVFVIDSTGEQMTLSQYKDYVRRKVIEVTRTKADFRNIWVDPQKREKFMKDLRESSIHPEVLAEITGRADADAYDLISNLVFDAPIRSRSERTTAFLNREQIFINRHKDQARAIILELLEKYRIGGIDQLEPAIFSVSPFKEMGGAVKISDFFGGVEQLGSTLQQMREKIYPEEEVAYAQ